MRNGIPIEGWMTLWDVRPDGLWLPIAKKRNNLMVTYGMAAAMLFGFGDSSYRINRFYVEYENVGNPNDVVSVPAYDVWDTRSYYEDLAAPRDYLRIPVLGSPTLSIAAGYEDYFSEDQGNKLTFVGMTSGSSGMNGLDFSDSVNSKVFGLALVASPDSGDRTKDVIVTRGYYSTGQQKVKASSGQIGVSWELIFKPVP
jgi:hypothetical protein